MIYLFPTEREATLFRAARPKAKIVICGVGMAAAAAAMSTLIDRNEEIILAGIAGSYDTDRHPINSVVEVVSERVGELPSRFAVEYRVPVRWGLTRTCATSNTVTRSNTPHPDAEVENMEGAAIFAICQAHDITVSQIRAISNHVAAPFSDWQVESAIEALTETLLTLR